MSQHTAEAVIQEVRKLSSQERTKFLHLLTSGLNDNNTHEQVFGHLKDTEFTAKQAAEYLEVSISTFRRYVGAKKIQASSSVGRSDMYPTGALKAFKQSMREVKGS